MLSEYAGAKRSYTTRAKEEQRRTCARHPTPLGGSTALTGTFILLYQRSRHPDRAAPSFTGRVRPWTKRWAPLGHLSVPRWVRVDDKSEGLLPIVTETPAGVAAPSDEVPVEETDEKFEAWRLARVKDRQHELEECAAALHPPLRDAATACARLQRLFAPSVRPLLTASGLGT